MGDSACLSASVSPLLEDSTIVFTLMNYSRDNPMSTRQIEALKGNHTGLSIPPLRRLCNEHLQVAICLVRVSLWLLLSAPHSAVNLGGRRPCFQPQPTSYTISPLHPLDAHSSFLSRALLCWIVARILLLLRVVGRINRQSALSPLGGIKDSSCRPQPVPPPRISYLHLPISSSNPQSPPPCRETPSQYC